jgi:hypothetical protein
MMILLAIGVALARCDDGGAVGRGAGRPFRVG